MDTKDYIKDGFLYCGKCHTRKEYVGTCLGKEIRVRVMCRCEAEEQAGKEEAMQKREEAQRIAAQKTSCIHDKALLDATFDHDDGKTPQLKFLKNYVESWPEQKAKNHGLLLYGDIGTGKTFCAGCVANALIEKDVPVLMTSFPKILNSLSSFGSDDKNGFIQDMMRYSLLVIDDFGLERNTEYAQEQVYSVIDERYKTKLPLIITTNKSLKELKKPRSMTEARIYDRILSMCVPVRFIGESRRKEDSLRMIAECANLFSKGE